MTISRGTHLVRVCTLGLALSGASAISATGAEQPLEFPQETAALVAATTALFDAVENTESETVPRIRIDGLAIPASVALDDAATGLFPLDHGPVRHLTGYRVNWYPVDRLLGAVDFMGTYDRNRGLVCGYVTWDVTDTEAPEVAQLVANYLDLGDLDGKSAEATQAALLDANCAYGDIDLNFTVFESAG